MGAEKTDADPDESGVGEGSGLHSGGEYIVARPPRKTTTRDPESSSSIARTATFDFQPFPEEIYEQKGG